MCSQFKPLDYAASHEMDARCVALTQDRRGHGQSTLVWYLARALAMSGLRVLVADLTGRHERLNALASSIRTRNLGIWKPAAPRPDRLPSMLLQARLRTRGHVDVILLDIDAVVLEHAGGFAAGIDYVLALVDPTETGQTTAEHLAERFSDAPPPSGHVGVIFCRASAAEAGNFPQQTEERHLPVIGSFPADYLLAGDDSDRRHGGQPVTPHDDYLQSVQRISRTLISLAELRRIPSAPTSDDHHTSANAS